MKAPLGASEEDAGPSHDHRFAGLAIDILESMGDGFYAVDPDWRLIYANRRACEMWGTTPETVIGQVLWERFPQMAGSEAERRLRDAVAARAVVEYETLSVEAQRWLSMRICPLPGGVTGVYWRDVTERRQADEALLDSRERFYTMLESLPQAAFVIRPDGMAEYYNRRFTDYVGHSIGIDPDSRTSLQHPEDRHLLVAARMQGAATDREYSVEARLRRHDGAYRWHLIRNLPLRRDGRTIAWLGTAVDIDDMRQAQEALLRVNEELEKRVGERTRDLAEANAQLRASEASLRALFRKAPVALHALSADRRIIDVNDEWLALLGYERDEVLGRPIADFVAPGSQAVRDAQWETMLREGRLGQIDRRYIAKSGHIIDCVLSAYVERDADGRFVRAIGAITDISARRAAEAKALSARQLAELLIESGTEGIIGLDRDFRYTVWNPAMEAISGVPRAQRLGRRIFEEARADLVGTPVEAAWRATMEGRPTTLRDRPYKFPESGRSGFFDIDFAPLYGPERSIIGGFAFLRDTTERRRVEGQLRQSQKMEALGQLTGGVSHDFNNLLTVILGNLENLRRYLPPGDEPGRMIAALTRAADRAATLTRRLLAFARLQPLDPKPIDVNRLVTGMSELLRRTLGESIVIETVLAGGLWRTLCDPNQLESALLNLAINARDAMPKGGKLTIETGNSHLDERYAGDHEDVTPGQYVMVAVSDTGIGMVKEILDKAFEPFFTTKEVGQGTGLGLSQVYGFAKQSGGHAKIYSEPGEGTTVKLYLPRLPVGAEEPASRPEPAASPAGRRDATVLVVEDDADVRQYATRLLSDLGYQVLEAPDGPTALRIVEKEPGIDLLFTDVGLPGGLNGRQLAEEARRRLPRLKVLFTTAYARNAIVHQGRLDPGVELVVKPFTSATLAAKVRRVLEEAGPASR
jgi:PAS domain S-box-containing protein